MYSHIQLRETNNSSYLRFDVCDKDGELWLFAALCNIFYNGKDYPCYVLEKKKRGGWRLRLCPRVPELIWRQVSDSRSQALTTARHSLAKKGLLKGTSPLPYAPSLGFPGGLGRSHVSVLGEPIARSPAPGARPLSRSALRANQTRVMPRREMRVAGNQGQGPGHNGAIVGLQSVDFQAAVPHPSSILLPTPAPCQEVTQTCCLLFGLRPKEAAFGILPRDGGGWAAPAMV